jgi:hypothetical protein
LFQAAGSDDLQDGCGLGSDEVGVRDAFGQEGDAAAREFSSPVTGPDRQPPVEKQEDLVLSLVDMDRNPAAPRRVASHAEAPLARERWAVLTRSTRPEPAAKTGPPRSQASADPVGDDSRIVYVLDIDHRSQIYHRPDDALRVFIGRLPAALNHH